MKILLLFLISFSLYANYIPGKQVESDVQDVFINKIDCEIEYHETCYKLPDGYNKNTHVLFGGKIVENHAKTLSWKAQKKQENESLNNRRLNVINNPLSAVKKKQLVDAMLMDYLQNKNIDPGE